MTRNARSHLRAYTLVDHDGMLLYRSLQHVTHNNVVEGKAMTEASLALHTVGDASLSIGGVTIFPSSQPLRRVNSGGP